MTSPRTGKPDLKSLDEHGRRLFCREGHRIEWDDARLPEVSLRYTTIRGGLCKTGDEWEMQLVGHGRGERRQLHHAGRAGWTNPGHLTVQRKTWYAQAGHEVGDTIQVTFNCSHGHFTARTSLASREKKYDREWPGVILQLNDIKRTDPREVMEYAIADLTELGWDFVTHDRIRCPDCSTEEAELEAKLKRLAELE